MLNQREGTMLHRRRLAMLAFAGCSCVLTARITFAQGGTPYPTHPIRLIVPYAAGGGTDAIARLVAEGVGHELGQSLVIENNGSGGGNLASQIAAKAAPDGYTIL